ncbi:MAG TPA: hypothetical protein DEP23_14675 [Ruminococcaceae bacterium]|nr:hypothetical protein [Oscillospiraceae bacterium]
MNSIIAFQPQNEEYTVKLLCNISEYNLIEVGGRYSQVYYLIYDQKDLNQGILKSMIRLPDTPT